MRQAIVTRYHGPGNVRGSRVSATASAGRIYLHWDDEAGNAGTPDNHRAAMLALCAKFGWNAVYQPGGLPDGSQVWVSREDVSPLEAAAPDLLDAARAALECIQQHVPATTFAPRLRLKDAIAKAEGTRT